MVQLNWTYQAKDDLINIADLISKDSKKYTRLQITKIITHTKALKSHILIGRIVPEFNKLDIRELIVGNYRIVYKVVSKNQIDILTIHHSSRNLHKIKF